MKLIMDASKNKDYLEKHDSELAEAIKDPDDYEASQERTRTVREVYIPENELKELHEMYSHVVVQDFEDEYHMSREDRESLRQRYAKFFALKQNYTKKIRKLDKYIEACRIALQIVDDTAEHNGILNPDEFRAMVLKGEIRINGLQLPKYIGRGKKTLNWDYVIDVMLDPSIDPKILMRDTLKEAEDDRPDISLDEDFIDQLIADAKEHQNDLDKPGMVNECDNTADFASPMSKKDQKLMRSICPGYDKVIKQINRRNSKRRENAMIWELDQDDIKWIEEYDNRQNRKRYGDAPEFTGDFTNNEDIEAYLFQMEEYERSTEMVEYHGSYVTQEDYDELKFKEILERNNYNLRNLYGNKEREKQRIKETKRNKKKIHTLKKMLAQIQEQNSDDSDKGLTGDIIMHTKEELESGGKINKKKKKNKKAKKKSKIMDDVLLSAVGSKADDMDEYFEEMSSMSLLK